MDAARIALTVVLLILVSGCAYVKTVAHQSGYAIKQTVFPGQRNYKHMLTRETFFVFGDIAYARNLNSEAVAVLAVSDTVTDAEVVDVCHLAGFDSYYGVNLPEGDYRLLLVSDLDRDGHYDADEVVGREEVSVSLAEFPDKVAAGKDIGLGLPENMVDTAFRIPVVNTAHEASSLFYPRGSIRSLDDPIFSPQMGSLGLYAPARFLETAPMMFYALEEDMPHKIPVVFVHGIGGSARDFESIVAELDRSRFRPWFFHYPSGMDLDQLAAMFHSVLLSGDVIALGDMPMVIVAHSMGGLVARKALNLQSNNPEEARVQKLITIASPLGGHPAVRGSQKSPVILPAWRDLHPDSEFILAMNQKPFPEQVEHHLFYAHNGDHPPESSNSTDGVVPLSSQLTAPAREKATALYGFEETHTGVITNQAVIQAIIRIAEEVTSPFPDPHMRELVKGGYEGDLGPGYTALEAYYLHNYAAYMQAMASGAISPVDSVQERFVRAVNGRSSPESALETAWVKFSREFPERL